METSEVCYAFEANVQSLSGIIYVQNTIQYIMVEILPNLTRI